MIIAIKKSLDIKVKEVSILSFKCNKLMALYPNPLKIEIQISGISRFIIFPWFEVG